MTTVFKTNFPQAQSYLLITQQNNSSCLWVGLSLNSVLIIIEQQCVLLHDMFLLLNKHLLTNLVILRCCGSQSGKTFLLLVTNLKII